MRMLCTELMSYCVLLVQPQLVAFLIPTFEYVTVAVVYGFSV